MRLREVGLVRGVLTLQRVLGGAAWNPGGGAQENPRQTQTAQQTHCF